MIRKKFLTLLLLPYVIILSCIGQGTIEFKVQYLPEATYTSRQQNRIVSELSFAIGKNEPLQKQVSDIMADSSIIVMTTGTLSEEGSFPITRHEIRHSKNQQGQPITTETTYYGSCFIGKQPVFDSIFRDDADSERNQKLLESIQRTYAETQMPDTLVSVGDQFSFRTRRSQPYMGDSIAFFLTSGIRVYNPQLNIAENVLNYQEHPANYHLPLR
jgi:hypothetical protein